MSAPAPRTTAASASRSSVKWSFAPVQSPLDRKGDVAGRSIGHPPEPLNLKARVPVADGRHLGLVRLVTDIAAGFVGVSLDGVDDKVVDGLRRIVEALAGGGAVIWRRTPGATHVAPTHSWAPPGLSLPEIPPVASVPWSMARLEEGKPVVFLETDDLPDPIDREAFRRSGYVSGAGVPLPADGSEPDVLRALMFHSLTRPEWSPEVVELLRTFAAVVGQALVGQKAGSALGRALEDIRRLRDRLDH